MNRAPSLNVAVISVLLVALAAGGLGFCLPWPRGAGAWTVALVLFLVAGPGALWLNRRLGRRLPTPQRRFLAGQCVRCGYDVRASPERCPECGRPILTVEGGFFPPSRPNRVAGTCPEAEEAAWVLTLRPPTPPGVWTSRAHAAIAAVIAGTCRDIGDWPNDYFRPADSFALMIDDWEGAAPLGVSFALRTQLGIQISAADVAAFRPLTFDEVVEAVATLPRSDPSDGRRRAP
jgi:hypothetical protein